MKLEARAVPGYEEVVFCEDEASGLSAIIVIHDTALGPAAGGCRMHPYASEADALGDALRLARGMSYKSALAELPFGGGKSVIIGDPARDKSEALLRAFGRFVDALEGRYIAAEDAGISVDDVEVMARESRFVAGRAKPGKTGGDPSPFTAQGVLVGVRATLGAVDGPEASLRGARVALQGLGQVGFALLRLLLDEGAHVVVADVRSERTEAAREIGAEVAEPDGILFETCDVLAPCALGGALTRDTVERLRCRIVAGAANNQLASPDVGDALAERGIVYAPDFVLNAGGITHVTAEILGHSPGWTEQRIEAIGPRIAAILAEARREGVAPHRVADALARRRLRGARLTRPC